MVVFGPYGGTLMILYHRIPPNLRGNVLHPMNTLRDTYPDIYEECRRSYSGREFLMEEIIAPLNCLWNDVIFMAAVTPSSLFTAMENAGLPRPRDIQAACIDSEMLDPSRMTVVSEMDINKPQIYERFEPNKEKQYAEVPARTIDYWQKAYARGQRVLYWMHIPHILYCGSIDITDVPRVSS